MKIMETKVLVLFDADGKVIKVLCGDSYYLHNNVEDLCSENGASTCQFSWLDDAG